MKNKTTKILQAVFAFLIVATMSCGLLTVATGKKIEADATAEIKVSRLVDSLIGAWELAKTIRYENGDTTVQAPSIALWVTPGAKPVTIIGIDSLQNFEIDQHCLKCPYLFSKGQLAVEIRTFRGSRFFYLNFMDNRFQQIKNKKRRERFSLEFSGFLTNFENEEMTITDKEGREWIYQRIQNAEK